MRPFSRIRNKLVVAFLFVVIAPLCVVGVYSIRHTTGILQRDAVDALWQETHLKAGQVEKLLAQARSDLFFISQSAYLKSFIEMTSGTPGPEYGTRKNKAAQQLAAFLERFPLYRRALVIDENGIERISIERTGTAVAPLPDAARDHSKDSYFAGTMRLFAGEVSVTPIPAEDSREAFFLFATRTFSSEMARKGILALEVSSRRFAEPLGDPGPDSLESVALVDAEGTLLLSRGSFPYPGGLRTSLPAEVAGKVLSGGNGVTTGPKGEIMAYSPIFPLPEKPSVFWSLTTVIPKEGILIVVTRYKRVFALILIAALGLAVVLSSFFARQLTEPITRLVHGTKRLGEGRLGHRTHVRTGDEIESLAAGFNAMAERLEEFYSSLEEKVAEKTLDLRQANVELERRKAELEKAYEELKETHLKLQESERELIQSEKLSSIGRLAASVAHEINNPIGIISLYSQLLKEEIDNPDSLKKLGLIIQHTQKVSHITRDLLDFSRKTRAEFKPVPAEHLLRASLEQARGRVDADRYQVEFHVADPTLHVLGEEGQLLQVFGNLVLNSFQAMPAGGRLILSADAAAEGMVALSVRDSGCGIPEAHFDKIFEPFFTTKPSGMGTGLGLSVCYGIVKTHKGKITVESRPDEGATFTVELPRA